MSSTDMVADRHTTGWPSTHATSRSFNGAVIAYALSCAWEIGLLDELDTVGKVDIGRFCVEHDLHQPTVAAVAHVLTANDVLTKAADELVAPGTEFDDAFRNKGYVYWLTRGCGRLLSELPRFARNEVRATERWVRDPVAIGAASGDAGRYFFDPPFARILADIDYRYVADLGCASGHRLTELLRGREQTRGLGLDIAPDAMAKGRTLAVELGVDDRVTFVEANVLDLAPRPEFAEVDLITCFFLGHDFWPKERAVATLRGLAAAFPNVQNLVLCDQCLTEEPPSADGSIFTLGFEFMHAVMDVYLPTRAEWLDAFAEAGWSCVRVIDVDLPMATTLFRLQPNR